MKSSHRIFSLQVSILNQIRSTQTVCISEGEPDSVYKSSIILESLTLIESRFFTHSTNEKEKVMSKKKSKKLHPNNVF